MISATDIRLALVSGQFENAELATITEALKYAQAQLTRRNVRAFCPGDLVKFTSNRDGKTYQGTIEKVAIKYINVRTPMGVYRVPGNMLEAI
jgi:hypothetical protein